MLANRTVLLAAAVAAVCSAVPGPAAAQPYPARPIRLIVPLAAGGPADTMARLTAQRLSMTIKQPVFVDNRPGASGTTGTRAAVGAEPDGYTLLFGNTATFAIGPAVYANIGYDPLQQFVPVALISVSYNVLVVSPKLPCDSVPELIAYAKANPGKINFASPGPGAPPHLIGEMFKQQAGIDIVHVPYKGTANALTDIMSGQVDMTFENPSVTVPLIKAGALKGLAVTGEQRNPEVPNLPTMIESGLPDFVSMSFTGLVAPAGTPPEIVRWLNAQINDGLRAPEMIAAYERLGLAAKPGSAEDFAVFLRKESEKWAAVAKRAGIRID